MIVNREIENLANKIAMELSSIHDLSEFDRDKLKKIGLLEEFYRVDDKIVIKPFDDKRLTELYPIKDINSSYIGVINKNKEIKVSSNSEYAFAKFKCNGNLSIKYINNLIRSFIDYECFLYYGLYIDDSLKDDMISTVVFFWVRLPA